MKIFLYCLKVLYILPKKVLTWILSKLRNFATFVVHKWSSKSNKLVILHRSSNFLVVDKPYDLLINTNDPNIKKSLQYEIREKFPDLANPKLCHDFYFVHRLDYVTSGVICIALNKQSAKAASTAFESRKAKKYYLALLHGHVSDSSIKITDPIGSDIREKTGNHRMCTSDSIYCEKPRKSCTGLLVLERGFFGEKPATKVLLFPGTGRRHQLRVHCSKIGHTVIGDYTYSNRQDTEPYRTFLHSYRLIISNNIENLDVRTEDPFDDRNTRIQWRTFEAVRELNENVFQEVAELLHEKT